MRFLKYKAAASLDDESTLLEATTLRTATEKPGVCSCCLSVVSTMKKKLSWLEEIVNYMKSKNKHTSFSTSVIQRLLKKIG